MKSPRLAALATLTLLSIAACDLEATGEPGDGDSAKADAIAGGLPSIESADDPTTIDVGSWNIEWFGDDERGPTDESLQEDNATAVLAGLELDIAGLVEIVSENAFADLMERLPGYRGLLVTDPSVTNGADYYSEGEQKVALLLKDRFEVESARVILLEHQWDFAGRPPMEVKLRFSEDGKTRTLVVIVAHFKARANQWSYEKRLAASLALEEFLDNEYPNRWVLVVGDLNDDIDESTAFGNPSPFASLVDDPDYRFTTDALTEAGESTTTHFSATIDHHLVTDNLEKRFVEGSAEVIRLDRDIVDYDKTTSDHYPVLTRYDLR